MVTPVPRSTVDAKDVPVCSVCGIQLVMNGDSMRCPDSHERWVREGPSRNWRRAPGIGFED